MLAISVMLFSWTKKLCFSLHRGVYNFIGYRLLTVGGNPVIPGGNSFIKTTGMVVEKLEF